MKVKMRILKNVVVSTPAYMLALERPRFFGQKVALSVGIMATSTARYIRDLSVCLVVAASDYTVR